jgi:hypothetical protein
MKRKFLGIIPIVLIVISAGCNMPGGYVTPTPIPTETPLAPTSTAIIEVVTATPLPPPQDPLVLRPTLCWQGPGPVYPTVSALKQNERVKLLGKGSINGWFIVDNPIYHDPCWVQASDLQLDPSTDLLSLRIFSPPPTPTPTRTATATYTPTPTP